MDPNDLKETIMYDFPPTNLEEGPHGLIAKMITFLKSKQWKQYICCFLAMSNLKTA